MSSRKCGCCRSRFLSVAVDWAIGIGLAVVKVALRLQGQPDVADMVSDVAGGSGGPVRGVRRRLGQKDLGELIASRVEAELPASSRTQLKADKETRAAAQIAADVVASLATDSKALANALAQPENFLEYVRDHGGNRDRQQFVAKHAETVYDQVLDAAARQLLVLAPTSARAMSAGMAEALQQLAGVRGQTEEIGRGVRDIHTAVGELLQHARQNASTPSARSGYLSTNALRMTLNIDSFQGRTWLEEELDEWITAHDSGYVVIEGQGGVGKTALLLHLAIARGWPHHFIHEHGSNPAVVFANIAAQLPADPETGEVRTETEGMDAAPNLYDLLASRAAALRESGDLPLVLVVDALDEIDHHTPGKMPVGLPTRLPPGVFAVLSRQPGSRELPTRYHRLQIRLKDERNIDDIRTAIYKFVGEPEIQKKLDASRMDPEALAETILQKVGGLWIYLKILTDEIREGHEGLNTIADIPEHLEEYFSRKLAADFFGGMGRWVKLSRPLLAALASGREPLSLDELCAIAGVTDIGEAGGLLRNEWMAFLDSRQEVGSAEVTYQLYHATLIDWIAGNWTNIPRVNEPPAILRMELRKASVSTHTAIAVAYLQAFGLDEVVRDAGDVASFPAGYDYGLRHLASHLVAAEMTSDLHRILRYQDTSGVTTNRWFELHQRAGSIRHFLSSLSIARWQARSLTLTEIDAGQPAESLALELRYMLIAALLQNRSANLPPELIVRFSRVPGRRAEAVAMARHAKPATRVASLAGISLSEPIDGELLIETLGELPLVNRGQYGKTSEAVLTVIAEKASETALPRFLDVLPSMDPDQQAQVICQISARLERIGLLDRGIAIARTLDYAGYRCDAFTKLASSVTDAALREQLLREAIDALIATDMMNEGIAERLALELSPVLLRETVHRLSALHPVTPNALCLQMAMVARIPASDDRQTEVSRLVRAAFEMRGVKARCEALTHIASVLSSGQRRQVLELARGLRDDYTTSRLLRTLAPYLDPPERGLALALGFELANGDRVLEALGALAPYLAPAEARQAIEQIDQVALPLVRANRALALATHLPNQSAERTSALNIALSACANLMGYEQAGVLVSTTELTAGEEALFRLATKHALESAPQYLVRLATIDAYSHHRADLLSMILNRFPEPANSPRNQKLVGAIVPLLDDSLTVQAVNVIRRAADNSTRSGRLIEVVQALAKLTAESLGSGTITHLLDIARSSGSASGTDDVMLALLEGGVGEPQRSQYLERLMRKNATQGNLHRLARTMSPQQLTTTLSQASTSRAAGKISAAKFVEIGVALAPAAVDELLTEILAAIEELSDRPTRVSARIALLPRVENPIERRRLTNLALSELRSMKSYLWYADLMSDLAAHRRDVADEAMVAIRDRIEGMFSDPVRDARCLDLVTSRMSDGQLEMWWMRSSKSKNVSFATAILRSAQDRIPKSALGDALIESVNNGDGSIAQRILSVAARSVDRALVDEFLVWIRQAVDADSYAELLCSLAGQIPDLVDDAVVACETMGDPVRRSRAAAHAALFVPPDVVERFLSLVRREQWTDSRSIILPRSFSDDFDEWIHTLLGRKLLKTWRYLGIVIGEPNFEGLLSLLPQIVELAGPAAREVIVSAVARTLRECCLGEYWEES